MPDIARRFFVKCGQIYKIYIEYALIKFMYMVESLPQKHAQENFQRVISIGKEALYNANDIS